MADDQLFGVLDNAQNDDTSLGRARSMTKTLEKKGKDATIPTNRMYCFNLLIINNFKSNIVFVVMFDKQR